MLDAHILTFAPHVHARVQVSACLQRPFSHPAVQDSLQQPMAPLPLHGEASSQHPSRTGGTLSAQGGAAAASTAQQQVEDGSLVGLGRTTSMAAGAAAPDRGGSGEGDGGGGAAAAAAVADTQGCAAGGTTTGGTAVTQLSKQQTAADSPEQQQQQQQGITLQLGSPVPNSCSNFMGTAREGSDLADDVSQKEAGGAEGELKGDTGALHLKGGGDDEECTQAQKGALREDGVNGQPSTNGQAGPNGQASAEEFRGCGEEVAGGAGAGREAGAAEGRQEKQEANWVTQTPPHDQQQQQLQQHPFPGGLGCSVTEGREGASDAWESEVRRVAMLAQGMRFRKPLISQLRCFPLCSSQGQDRHQQHCLSSMPAFVMAKGGCCSRSAGTVGHLRLDGFRI
eukprot:1156319-Pelagomonas_calceolata.AAC.15